MKRSIKRVKKINQICEGLSEISAPNIAMCIYHGCWYTNTEDHKSETEFACSHC
jgi:hypothetical protein